MFLGLIFLKDMCNFLLFVIVVIILQKVLYNMSLPAYLYDSEQNFHLLDFSLIFLYIKSEQQKLS